MRKITDSVNPEHQTMTIYIAMLFMYSTNYSISWKQNLILNFLLADGELVSPKVSTFSGKPRSTVKVLSLNCKTAIILSKNVLMQFCYCLETHTR